jgi:hypothetical protein
VEGLASPMFFQGFFALMSQNSLKRTCCPLTFSRVGWPILARGFLPFGWAETRARTRVRGFIQQPFSFVAVAELLGKIVRNVVVSSLKQL